MGTVETDWPLSINPQSSHSVGVSLIAGPSFSTGSLQISSNDSGSPQTVSVIASIAALPAEGESQLLVLQGQVSGELPSGSPQVVATHDEAELGRTAVEGDGGYRLVLMQLPLLGSLGATDQIVLALEDGQGKKLKSL